MTRAEKVASGMGKVRRVKQQSAGTAVSEAFKDALNKMTDVLAEDSAAVEAVEPSVDRVGAFAIGNDSYQIMSDGSCTFLRGRRVYAMPLAVSPRASLEVIAEINGIPIPSGLTVIFGGADEGKTPILRHVGRVAAEQVSTTNIRYGEPLPGYLRDTESLASAIIQAVASGDAPRLITVDSFKNIVGRLGGNATKGGLSRELFPWFSDVSSYLAEAGVAMVTVLNVSSAQRAVIDEVIEGLASNCTSTWQVENGHINWQARVGEGRRRRTGSSVITWGGDGLIDRLHSISGEGSSGSEPWGPLTGERHQHNVNVIRAGSIDPADMNRSVARLVRSTLPK